jgi:sodium-dependent dicarboxylate transporter 2/3/5
MSAGKLSLIARNLALLGLAFALCALLGGIATPAGCGSNPIALQFLSSMAGIHLSFLEWMAYGVPSALLAACLFFLPGMSRRKWKEIEAEVDCARSNAAGRLAGVLRGTP